MHDQTAPNAAEFLLFGWDGGGNVPPLMALGRHLLRRGHHVRMVGTDTMASRAEAAEIDFTRFVRSPSWTPQPRRAIEDEMDAFATHLLGPELGEELLAACDKSRPDAVVIDCMAGGALSAAEYLALPTAVLVHLRARFHYDAAGGSSVASLAAKQSLNRQRVRLGLKPLAVEGSLWAQLWPKAGHVFIASLPELEGPGAPLPASFSYVGGVFDPDPADLPPDVADLATRGGRPLVVTSLSTTYMRQEQQLAAARSALHGLRGVITMGEGFDPHRFRRDEQVVLARWAPHATLLPYADVVVTHAGHGTVIASLAAGVPLVCLPMGRDQHGNAAQVARLGLGVCVDSSADAAQLRAAVDRVLSEPSYRLNAGRLAASMRRLGGGARLAADIESLIPAAQVSAAVTSTPRRKF